MVIATPTPEFSQAPEERHGPGSETGANGKNLPLDTFPTLCHHAALSETQNQFSLTRETSMNGWPG